MNPNEMVGEWGVRNDTLDGGHVARDAAGGWIDRADRRMWGFGERSATTEVVQLLGKPVP